MQRNNKEIVEMNQNRTITKKLHADVRKGLKKLFGFNFWHNKVVARGLLKLKQRF